MESILTSFPSEFQIIRLLLARALAHTHTNTHNRTHTLHTYMYLVVGPIDLHFNIKSLAQAGVMRIIVKTYVSTFPT